MLAKLWLGPKLGSNKLLQLTWSETEVDCMFSGFNQLLQKIFGTNCCCAFALRKCFGFLKRLFVCCSVRRPPTPVQDYGFLEPVGLSGMLTVDCMIPGSTQLTNSSFLPSV